MRFISLLLTMAQHARKFSDAKVSIFFIMMQPNQKICFIHCPSGDAKGRGCRRERSSFSPFEHGNSSRFCLPRPVRTLCVCLVSSFSLSGVSTLVYCLKPYERCAYYAGDVIPEWGCVSSPYRSFVRGTYFEVRPDVLRVSELFIYASKGVTCI